MKGSITRSAHTLLLLVIRQFFVSAERFPVSHSDATFACDCVGREGEKLFVLTFDDGPWQYTSGILDILATKGAPATFFVIGSNFESFPAYAEHYEELVQRTLREGHIVANHGLTNDEFTLQDVEDCHAKIHNVTNGYDMKYFRPAQGAYTKAKYEGLVQKGYRMIMWNLDIADWRSDRDPNEILALVRSAVTQPTSPAPGNDFSNARLPRRGSFIMLAHDNHIKMLQPVSGGSPLLAAMIDTIREAGYRIVSLDECLGDASSSVSVDDREGGSGGIGSYCGTSWSEAQGCGQGECPGGMDVECPTGMKCFGSVTCPGSSNGSQRKGYDREASGSSDEEEGGWDWSALEVSSGWRMRWQTSLPVIGFLSVSSFMNVF